MHQWAATTPRPLPSPSLGPAPTDPRRGERGVSILLAMLVLFVLVVVIFQVKVGSYLGQHFGRITKISETEVALKELVQDAAGDWVERDTSLALQEAKK